MDEEQQARREFRQQWVTGKLKGRFIRIIHPKPNVIVRIFAWESSNGFQGTYSITYTERSVTPITRLSQLEKVDPSMSLKTR